MENFLQENLGLFFRSLQKAEDNFHRPKFAGKSLSSTQRLKKGKKGKKGKRKREKERERERERETEREREREREKKKKTEGKTLENKVFVIELSGSDFFKCRA